MKLHELFEADDLSDESWTAPSWDEQADVKVSVFPLLQKKIDQLNKRATKLGVPAIKIEVTGTVDKPVLDKHGKPDKFGKTEKYNTVKITGQAPQLAGWKFVGTIEHKDGGNVIRTVPGEETAEELKKFYSARPDYCDHCKKKRNRVDTYIVKNEKTNDMKQIGRNCIKDFLGGKDPKAILWWFSIKDSVTSLAKDAEEKGEAKGIRGEEQAGIVSVLTAGAAAVRKYGYRKSSGDNGYNGSTPHMVRLTVFGYPPKKDDQAYDWYETCSNPTPQDEQTAEAVLDWFKNLPADQKQDQFVHNIDVIINSSGVSSRDVGYVIALFPMYARAQGQIKTKTNQPAKSNLHIGLEGHQIPPTEVTVIRTKWISGQFGNTQIVNMEDADGNTYVWFNNSRTEMEDGKKYNIVGTVKKHDEFNGRNQTNLTRVKVVK